LTPMHGYREAGPEMTRPPVTPALAPGPSLGNRPQLTLVGRLRVRTWLVRHLQTFFFSLGLLLRAPLASLMSAAVIGVALALPTGLYLLLDNLGQLGRQWGSATHVSLFLHQEVDEARAKTLAGAMGRYPGVAAVQVISREQALAEYKHHSGFGAVMDSFAEHNPLPVVVVLDLDTAVVGASSLDALLQEMAAAPEVELAQYDLAWLKRLDGIIGLLRQSIWVLAGLLAMGVVLIMGNTIRLNIEHRREEIEITRLFGATDAFVRRPFLYSGLLYGFTGGLLALLLTGVAVALLQAPVAHLSALYGSGFGLTGMSAGSGVLLVVLGALLGWLGSWVAVSRHLSALAPD